MSEEELKSELKKAQNYIRQLESLLGRINKATEQFYKKQEEDHRKKPDTVPYQRIVDLYHHYCPDLPQVRALSRKRMIAMRKRWTDQLRDIDDWADYFKDVSRKEFLLGKNERGWKADIDFLLREDTVIRMQEGKYDG